MGVCIRVLCTLSNKIYVSLTLAVESASLALDLSAHLLSDISAESILCTHFSICTNFCPAALYFRLLSVQLQMIQFIALTLPRPCMPLVALRCSEWPRMLFLYHRLSDPYCCSGCSTIWFTLTFPGHADEYQTNCDVWAFKVSSNGRVPCLDHAVDIIRYVWGVFFYPLRSSTIYKECFFEIKSLFNKSTGYAWFYRSWCFVLFFSVSLVNSWWQKCTKYVPIKATKLKTK